MLKPFIKPNQNLLAALLLHFSRLLLSCAGIALWNTQAYAIEPIKFGTTQALTGHYEDFGVQQLRGLQMWVEDVNERGALLGRPVSLTYYDDYSRDAGTVKGFLKLLAEDKVEFLIGPYSSSLTLEASLIAEQFGVPMVATGASSEEIWSRGLQNIFGIDTPTGNYLQGFTLPKQVGAKTVALVYADTEFPREVAQSMRKNAQATGLKIVLDEAYPPPERNFSALVNKLAKADADLIFGASYLEDSVALTRALKAKGVKPKMLAFTVGPALREFGDLLGEDAEGIVGLVQWLRSIRLPGAQDFAYRYRQRYGENPGVHAAIGYSAGQVMETAIRLAGTTEHAAVRKQLRTMFFRSLLGKYQVDETGRQIGKHNYVLQWQDDARRLVAPRQLAEKALIYPLP
ncbi:MAG: amino acid ABC transporter substrate-binding protein [Halioglobus sp.]